MGEALSSEFMHWVEEQGGFPGWQELLAVQGISGLLSEFEAWLEREKGKRLYK